MNAFMNQIQENVSAFWMERNARERKQIGLVLVLVACALLYMLFVAPALSGRMQLEKSLPELRLQAAELQNLSKEAATLSAATATPAPPVTKEIIESALASKGLKSQSVAATGDVIKVQLSDVSFTGMLDWLDEMQKNMRVTVVDANITAQAQSDIVNATLTLRQ
ncbi:MAG TPA: type II secretion system protein GspM [Burkholderiaceae bacterium]|jgi:general secretion pathway protein M